MEEDREACYLPDQLQKFRLPIFQRISHLLDEKAAKVHGLGMRGLLLHIGEPTEKPMPDEADHKKPNCHPGEAIAGENRFPHTQASCGHFDLTEFASRGAVLAERRCADGPH